MRKNRGRIQTWRAFYSSLGLDGREATRAARDKVKAEEKDREQLLEAENAKSTDPKNPDPPNEPAPPAEKNSVANSTP